MKKIVSIFVLFLLVSAPAFAQKYASVKAKRANIRTCAGTKCAIKWYAWKYTPVINGLQAPSRRWCSQLP